MASMDTIYRLGPIKITRKNLIRLIVTDILTLLIILIPVLIAFAAEMLNGGTFATSGEFSTNWTPVNVTSGLTTTWDSAGQANGGSVRFETSVGRNNSGEAYIYQATTGSILAADVVQLTFWWKKDFVSVTPGTHNIYVEIQKPSTTVTRIWTESTLGTVGWTQYSQDVSSFFNEDGVYQIRFGASLANANDRNAQTIARFDEVSLDAQPAVDTEPPTVSITDPLDGNVVGGIYTVTADATDNIAVDRVEFFYDGANLIGTDTSAPYSVSWDTTGLAETGHTLTATAYDTWTPANSATSTPVNVTVDNTDPTSTITDPTPSQLLPRTSYPIIGTANDTNFQQYTLEYGAGASPSVWNNIGTNPYTSPVVSGTLGTWNTSAVSDGSYTIRLITTDDAANSSTYTVLVDVDSTLPTVVSATAVGSTLVDVLFSEELAPATVLSSYFTIDNGLSVTGATLQPDNQTVRLDTASQTPALTYTVTAKNTAPTIEDLAGNIVGTPNTTTFDGYTPDTVPPTVSITDPIDGQYLSGTYSITADATDDRGVQQVEFYYGGILIGTDYAEPWSFDWDTTAVAENTYSLTARAYDTENSTTSTAVSVTVDNTDPTSVITVPGAEQYVKGSSIAITGSSNDTNFSQYTLKVARGKLPAGTSFVDIGTNPRVTPVNNGTLGTWDASAEPDGDYTIELETQDLGNRVVTTTVRVILDDTPPVVRSAKAVNSTTVDVVFGEHIGATLDPVYFSIPGLTVSGTPTRLEDNRTVRLTTNTQTPDTNYTVTVRSTSPTVADAGGTEIVAANNTADFLGFNSSSIRGDGNLLRRHGDDPSCGGMMMGCHNILTHSSDASTSDYGNWGRDFNCLTCHTPHGSTNIYLVKETITTPNSGDKTVDFRTTGLGDAYNDPDPVPGTHDYSLGDATDGFNDSVCEVCHTQTQRFTNNDATTPDTDHRNDENCSSSSCHPHTFGFRKPLGAAESPGGLPCSQCHGGLYGGMNSDTSTYHHYMQNDAPTYSVVADSSTLTANDTNKRCLMCHVDHNVFRPDLNAANGGQRAKNLRETVKSTVTTSTNFTNSDYLSGHADGGICLSCHTNSMTKNTTAQKDDGTTTTMVVDKAPYDAATNAHNYAATSTFESDSSTFNANCSKCHTDTTTKSYQGSSGNAFGTHLSLWDRILAALGIASPTDPLEENFCYECHTGGAAASGPDYYNVVTMDQSAINVKDMFAKTSKHPVSATSGKHKPTEASTATVGWNPRANRHVECADCHNPHAAQDGLHTVGSNVIGPPLLGQWGVKPTAWGAAGSQHTNFTVVNLTATSGDNLQAYLCFKCHSYFAFQNNPPDIPSGMPDGSTAVETDQVTEFNPSNLAHHAVISPGNHPANANFTQTFVAPWGPGSTVSCSDCHASDTSVSPEGAHGSNNKWLLRSNETGAGTAVVFCYNCHRRDVYGDDGYSPPNATLSRVSHPINSNHSGTPPKTGIWCMNCHGGVGPGGIHGTNLDAGTAGGTNLRGERFLNGAAILGITRATTTNNSGKCWTKGNTDSVNNCTKGHGGQGWTANYNL